MKFSRQEYCSGLPFSENTLILCFICTFPVFSIPFIEETILFFFAGHEFEQTLGDGEGQGGMACCSTWGCKEFGHNLVTEQQQKKKRKQKLRFWRMGSEGLEDRCFSTLFLYIDFSSL